MIRLEFYINSLITFFYIIVIYLLYCFFYFHTLIYAIELHDSKILIIIVNRIFIRC